MNTDIAAQKALDRLAQIGFGLLTENEKIVAAVWTFEAQVVNRGFARYFSSTAGDMARFSPIAFKSIGALQKAEIAAKANEVFGAGGPPANRKVRRELVRAFGANTKTAFDALEREYYESPEDVDELLELFLNKKQ
jgi:NAD/NADP transhydrogenase alpha subunit